MFDLVVNGNLTPSIVRRYDLADAPQAHRDLASPPDHRQAAAALTLLTGEGR